MAVLSSEGPGVHNASDIFDRQCLVCLDHRGAPSLGYGCIRAMPRDAGVSGTTIRARPRCHGHRLRSLGHACGAKLGPREAEIAAVQDSGVRGRRSYGQDACKVFGIAAY